jgi:hypothetical protein
VSAAPKLTDEEREQLAGDLAQLRALADRIATRYGLDVKPATAAVPRRRRTRIAAAAEVSEAELAGVASEARGVGYRVREGR